MAPSTTVVIANEKARVQRVDSFVDLEKQALPTEHLELVTYHKDQPEAARWIHQQGTRNVVHPESFFIQAHG